MKYCSDQFLLLFFVNLFLHGVFPEVRKPKVYQFKVHAIFVQEKEILWLQIPMSDMLVMAITDAFDHLLKQNSSIVL